LNLLVDTPNLAVIGVVLDDQEVYAILGKGIRSNAGEDMGRIVDVIVSQDGQIHAAIIDFGGFLAIGIRKIAVDWSGASDSTPRRRPAIDFPCCC
jgi:hypothetical protein